MTIGNEMETVPRETSALLLTLPEGVPTKMANVDVLADARAEARSWAPNTRRAYVAGWKVFTSWCIEHRCPGLPAAPADVGRYIEHLVESEGKTLATVRLRLAAIAAAHRLGGHEDPTTRLVVKATVKRLAREYGRPRKQAKGLTNEALAAVKATTRIQRVHQGKRRRKETEAEAAGRAAVDLALLQVMRDGLLRRAEASALRWGDLEFHEDGSGRLHVLRSRTDQIAEGAVLYLGPAAVESLLAIRPQEALIDPNTRVFGLSASQICRRIKAATKMAGLGEGFSAHSPRVGMAQDLSAAGRGAAGAYDRRKMGESHDASQVHRGPDRRQGRRRSLLPGRPPGIRLMGAAAVGGMTARLLGGPIKVR